MSNADDPRVDLIGAYALDAVDEDERAEVERLVVQDPAARAEFVRLSSAADAFVAASMEDYLRDDPPSPPRDLWQRIAAQLPPTVDAPPAQTPEASPKDDLAERRRQRQVRYRRIAGVVAAAAAVAGLAFVAGRAVEDSAPAPELAVGLDQRANAAFAAPGARQGNLLADNGEVVARVVVDPNGQGYVQGTALIALDDGRAYQLWSLDTGQPVSLGLLGRNPSTSAFASNANASRLALSIEPVSGSTQPTSKPIAVAELR